MIELPDGKEAVQLHWDHWEEICAWAGVGQLRDNRPQGSLETENREHETLPGTTTELGLSIDEPAGVLMAYPGDWIIKDTNGNLNSCIDAVFRAQYPDVA